MIQEERKQTVPHKNLSTAATPSQANNANQDKEDRDLPDNNEQAEDIENEQKRKEALTERD